MNSKWAALTVSFILTAVMFVPYVGYSVGSLDIMNQFSISYTELGLLATATAITGGLVFPYAGFLADKYGSKRIILAGLMILVLGQLLFAYAPVYSILLISRIILGVGIAILLIAPYTLVIHWFSKSKSTGLGLGIMIGTDGIGTLIATYLFAYLFIMTGWRNSTVISAVLLFVLLLLSWKLLKEPQQDQDNTNLNFNMKNVTSVLKERNVIGGVIFLTALFSVYNLSVYWIPTILMEEVKWSEEISGFIGASFAIAGILGSFMFGYISDKLKKRKFFILVALAGMLVSFIGFSYFYITSNYLALAILLPVTGLFAYGGPAVVYSLVAESVASVKVGLANGLVLGIGMIAGGSIVPVLVGYIKDITGQYTTGFIIISLYLAAFLLLSIFLVKDRPEKEVLSIPKDTEVEKVEVV